MSNRGPIHWGNALAALKADRATRSEIREERLKSTAGLRGTPVLPLTAWRGRSGRRYVAGIHLATAAAMEDFDVQDCLIFVARDADNVGRIVGCASGVSPLAVRRAEVLRDAVREGATEIHCHRLCVSDAERLAMVNDLAPSLVFA